MRMTSATVVVQNHRNLWYMRLSHTKSPTFLVYSYIPWYIVILLLFVCKEYNPFKNAIWMLQILESALFTFLLPNILHY